MSVLAIDIGSSRIKALLADWEGRLIDVLRVATPQQSLEPGERAYPAAKVHSAVEGLIRRIVAKHPREPVDTIVFSCLGTAMVPLDREARPLGPALAPADARPQQGPPLLSELGLDGDALHRSTGSDPEVASFLLHVRWWQRTHPEVMERLHRFRSLRGFVLHELCDTDAEDRAWASRTMLFDLDADDWSEDILHALGLPVEALPVVEAPTATFPISQAAIERLGLAPRARAVLGAMDNGCALLGADGMDRSGLVNIVGTYEHMAAAADLETARAVGSESGAVVHAYVLPGRFITMTRVPIGDLLTRATSGDGIGSALEQVSEKPSGTHIGLTQAALEEALAGGDAPGKLVQALLESAAHVLARFADAWASRGLPDDPVAVVGGGVSHLAALRLKANILGRSLATLGSGEAAGLGALRLAAMGARGATVDEACELFDNPVASMVQPQRTAGTAPPKGDPER